MPKFAALAHEVLHTYKGNCPSSSLPRPLVNTASDFFRPLNFQNILDKGWITDVCDADFLERFLQGTLSTEACRRIGFREETSRPELIKRTVLEVGGTVLACQLALRYGIASNLAGGTHHAHPHGGAGYTIINDLAVAAYVLTTVSNVERVLVVDCDVHQGDGTALFGRQDRFYDKLFTLSLHCASNYPHPKQLSTIDIPLDDGLEDKDYLDVLSDALEKAIESVQPGFVLYDAGVDVFKGDVLGRLSLSEAGIRQRDRYVLNSCVAKGIPVAAVIGGGYDKHLQQLARRHAIAHEECAHVWRKFKMWDSEYCTQ